jgi:hypothetical protein
MKVQCRGKEFHHELSIYQRIKVLEHRLKSLIYQQGH